MKCHYEVLELSREADDSEIKSAYRKLALKWHPDKNLDNPDLAKEQFQVVQQAYEVLSDRQERAWYDAHRDQILRGANSEYQDKSLDVFQYFTTTCFKGYADNDEGFYSVYRKIFDQIAKEDIEFMDEKEEFCEIPSFGRSDSVYELVKEFYDYWMSYSTKKSYSWLDPHDIREGKGDRRLLKIIEKENKKIRLKARKERNEEVRNLIAFVRKRDKRVLAFKKEMEAKTLENRKKQEELSKQKRLERLQMHESEKQAEWLKFDNVKSGLEEIEKHLDQEFGEELSQSEDEEEDFNNLYCVACNKIFKNPRAFENHEVSKRHKENVEKLRETMLVEDIESNLTDDLDEYNDLAQNIDNLECDIEANDVCISGEDSIADEDDVPEISETTKKKKKSKNKKGLNLKVELQDDLNISDDNQGDSSDLSNGNGQVDSDNELSDDKLVKTNKKKKKKTKHILNTLQNGLSNPISQDLDVTKISDDEFEFGSNKNQKKKTKKNKANKSKSSAANTDKQGEEEPIDNVAAEESLKNSTTSKRQARKDKKASRKDPEPAELSKIDLSHCCVTCQGNFSSKNKLFEHLKKTGHGVYLPTAKTKQSTKKGNVKN